MLEEKYLLTARLSARQKAAFMAAAATTDKEGLYKLVKATAKKAAQTFGFSATETQWVAEDLLAIGLAVQAVNNATSAADYLSAYAAWKLAVYTRLNDKGALGDLVETIVHAIAARRVWRTKTQHLHVSSIGKTDVKINGINFEVGHNAKTWNDATESDFMAGKFQGVIYGVQTTEELVQIVKIMATDVRKGTAELAKMLYVWTDKQDFYEFMQTALGRSETLKYRQDINKVVTVYNGSKHAAFIKAIENTSVPTLADYIGENDWC